MECHEFDIEILPDGQVKVHIKGVKGQACLDYVKLFEQIMGEATQIQHTAEYYAPPTGVGIHVEHKSEGETRET